MRGCPQEFPGTENFLLRAKNLCKEVCTFLPTQKIFWRRKFLPYRMNFSRVEHTVHYTSTGTIKISEWRNQLTSQNVSVTMLRNYLDSFVAQPGAAARPGAVSV